MVDFDGDDVFASDEVGGIKCVFEEGVFIAAADSVLGAGG